MSQPSSGSVAILGPDQLRYTPATDFVGRAVFSYTVSDGLENSQAQVSVGVVPRNNAPRTRNDVRRATTGFPVRIAALANDFDPDGHGMKIISARAAGQSRTEAQPGVIAINPDAASLTYLSQRAGSYNFVYTVQDIGGDYALTADGSVALEVRDYNPSDPIQYLFTGLGEQYTIRSGENQRFLRTLKVTNLTDLATRAGLVYQLGANVEVVDLTATTDSGVCRTDRGRIDCDFGIVPNLAEVVVRIDATVYAKVSGTLSEQASLTSVNPIVGGALPPLNATTTIQPRRESRTLRLTAFDVAITGDSFVPLPDGRLEINGSDASPVRIGEHFRLSGRLLLSPDGAYTAFGLLRLISEAEPGGMQIVNGEFFSPGWTSVISSTLSLAAPLPFPQQNSRVDWVDWNTGEVRFKSELLLRFNSQDEVIFPVDITYGPINAPALYKWGEQVLNFSQADEMFLTFGSMRLVREGGRQYLRGSGQLDLPNVSRLQVQLDLTIQPGDYASLQGVGRSEEVSFRTSRGIVTLVDPRLDGNRFYAAGGTYLTSAHDGSGSGADMELTFGPYGMETPADGDEPDLGDTYTALGDGSIFLYFERKRILQITLPENNKIEVEDFTLGEEAENDDITLTVAGRKMILASPILDTDGKLTADAEIEMPGEFNWMKLPLGEVTIGVEEDCGEEDVFGQPEVGTDDFCVADFEEIEVNVASALGATINKVAIEAEETRYKLSIYGTVTGIGSSGENNTVKLQAEVPLRADIYPDDIKFGFEGLSFEIAFLSFVLKSPFTFTKDEFAVGELSGGLQIPPTTKEGSEDEAKTISLSGKNILWQYGRLQNLEAEIVGLDVIPKFPIKEVRLKVSSNPDNTYNIDAGGKFSLGFKSKPKVGKSKTTANAPEPKVVPQPRGSCAEGADVDIMVFLRTADFWFYGGRLEVECDYPLVLGPTPAGPHPVVATSLMGSLDLRPQYVGPNLDEKTDSLIASIGLGLGIGNAGDVKILTLDPTLTLEKPHWINKQKKEKYDWYISLSSGAKLLDTIELGEASITTGWTPFFIEAEVKAKTPLKLAIIQLDKLTGKMSFWIVDGKMFFYGATEIAIVITPQAFASWMPSVPQVNLSTGIEMGEFKYKNKKDTVFGMRGHANVSINVLLASLKWSGKFFLDSKFNVTTGGDVDNFKAITRERVRRAWERTAATARQAAFTDPTLKILPADTDVTFDQRSLIRLRSTDATAGTLSGPQSVAVDVPVPYVTDVRIILDSQVGGPSMTLTAPDGARYGHDNLPAWITYTENVTYVPGPGLSPTAQAGEGRLRAVHGLVGGAALDVMVDGQVAFSGLAYQNVTNYRSFAPGNHTIAFVPAGSAGPALAETVVDLAPGQDFTLLLMGSSPNDSQIWPLTDDNHPLGRGAVAYLRLINISPMGVSLQERMGGAIFKGITAPGLGDYTVVFAKPTTLDILRTFAQVGWNAGMRGLRNSARR